MRHWTRACPARSATPLSLLPACGALGARPSHLGALAETLAVRGRARSGSRLGARSGRQPRRRLAVVEDQRPVLERPVADHLPVSAVVLRVDPRLAITLLREAVHHALHVAGREAVDP